MGQICDACIGNKKDENLDEEAKSFLTEKKGNIKIEYIQII